ncbi:MAG: hypothetical protein IPI78_07625 [Chitinophagaceae bacterium]|nr:hypothetical protein [Chitinophagaceae bacterium]
MKKILITILVSAYSFLTYSQTTIKLEDITKHVGDSVKVCGKVYGIRFMEQSKNQPTL